MANRKNRIRYYTIYFKAGQYLSMPAVDINQAQEDYKYLAQQEGIIAFGIYDPLDWAFDWLADEHIQNEHTDQVNVLIVILQQRHL